MIVVATKDNRTFGVPEEMSSDDIGRNISDFDRGTIKADQPSLIEAPGRAISNTIREKFPSFYDKVFAPAFKGMGDNLMNPNFFLADQEKTPQRAFGVSAIRTASFNLIPAPADEPQLMQEHPVASIAGSFAGFVPAIKAVNEALFLVKYPQIAGNIFLKPLIKLSNSLAAANPETARVMTPLVTGVANALQAGAQMGTYKLLANAGDLANRPGDKVDISALGDGVLKDAGMFGLAGGVTGAMIKPFGNLMPAEKAAQTVKELSVTAGSLYAISKASGEDDNDALLVAGMGALYHFVHIAGNTLQARQYATEEAKQVVAGYLKAKNPMAADEVVVRAAEEHIQQTAKDLIKEVNDLATKFSDVGGTGIDVNVTPEMKGAGNGSESPVKIEYHGTSPENAEKILKDKKINVGPGQAGVSTTQDYKEALDYAGGDPRGVIAVRIKDGAEMVGIPGKDFLTGTGSFSSDDVTPIEIAKNPEDESNIIPITIDDLHKSGEQIPEDKLETAQKLVDGLNKMQEDLGTSLRRADEYVAKGQKPFNSVFRSQAKQDEMRAEKNEDGTPKYPTAAEVSIHSEGGAVDIPTKSLKLDQQKVAEAANRAGFLVEDITKTPDHVHVELPSDKSQLEKEGLLMKFEEKKEDRTKFWQEVADKQLAQVKGKDVVVKKSSSSNAWIYDIGNGSWLTSPYSTKAKSIEHAKKQQAEFIDYYESGRFVEDNKIAEARGLNIHPDQRPVIDQVVESKETTQELIKTIIDQIHAEVKQAPEDIQVSLQDIGKDGANLPDEQFDQQALQDGTQREMEHTSNIEIAKRIAKDHLNEDPEYYKKLEQIEPSGDIVKSGEGSHGEGTGPTESRGVGSASSERPAESESAGNGGGAMESRGAEPVAEGVNDTGMAPVSETGNEPPVKNYRITDADQIGTGGIKTKYKQNISAIKLLKKIEAENRPATTEEQAQLVKYVGWGGMSQAFDRYNSDWEKEYKEIKDLLLPEEYEAARASTINAHYTAPEVIKAVWQAVANMGFHRGNVLEPAAGVGHFVGFAPQDGKKFSMVELDSISGRIAKLVYPESSVQVTGFQEAALPSNYYGLSISNVPFSSYQPYDRKAKELGIPSDLVLHDYFFAKALSTVKPGGIVAFITSAGTMDKKDMSFREYLDKKAHFLGAIRLPSDAFKKNANTEVVTDIIFLQKLKPGEHYNNQDFITTGEFKKKDMTIDVNKYFLDNPEMVLGKMDIGSGLYSDNEMTVKNTGDFDTKLQAAINKLPKDIYETVVEKEIDTIGESIEDHAAVKENAYVIKDGAVFQKVDNKLVKQEIDTKDAKKLSALVDIRDTVRDLLNAERTDRDESIIKQMRKTLNEQYDAFVKKYGPINESENINLVLDDPDSPLLSSLEDVKKVGKKYEYRKREIFTQRINKPHVKPTSANNVDEAMKISLGEYGEINWPYMKDLLKMEIPNIQESMLKQGLIFRDPNGDRLVTKDEYLSGNVKKKLSEAEDAANVNPIFQSNVEALKAVIPPYKTFDKIRVNIGMPWIRPNTYNQFLRSIGISGKAIFNSATGSWDIEKGTGFYNYGASLTEYGVPGLSAEKIFEKVMNGKPIKVMKTVYDSEGEKKSVIDEEQSALAEEKGALMKEKFKQWFWENDSRRTEYEEIYNTEWNHTVPRKYDGSHLVFPGMNPAGLPGPLRSTQMNAIWRGIITNRVMLAHSVGAGKTAIMTIIAMESKRLGLVNKTLIIAPKNTIPSWRNHINSLYPAAKALVANEKNFDSKKLKGFLASIATGNWDVVVMSHDNYESLKVSPEAYKSYVQEQINDLRDAKDEAKRAGSRISVKNIETSIQQLQAKLDETLDQSKKIDLLSFEELGIDALHVDEADLFKNLAYTTQKQGIKGMGTQTGSVRAMDMKMKTDIIRAKAGKLIFATGTPISNSMVEMYTMMKYLQPEMLKEQGIKSFDAWSNTFADPSTESEIDVTGARYKLVTRFKNFMNMNELRTMIGEVWDIQTQKMLIDAGVLKRGVNLPQIKGGKAANVVMPISKELVAYTQTLLDRASEIEKRKGKVKKGDDIMLTVMMDGIKAALDMRMIDPTLPANPDSKVEWTIRSVLEKYKEYGPVKGTQLIFIDKPAPDPKAPFNPQEYMKKQLIAGGIPANEIAFIHDFEKDAEKEALYEKMNSGEVRVLFGSTEKLGAGTNIQKRLAVVYHLGIPSAMRPRDITQREGRIDRPGNMNKEIEIYRLAQKGSLDTFIYQLLEAKSKTVEQFMRGDVDMTDINEDDVDPYEAMKALSSENPLVKEKAEVDRDVRKYKVLYNAYLGERTKAANIAKAIPAKIDANKKSLDVYESFKSKLPEKPTKETFSITIGSEEIKDKAAALKAIQSALSSVEINSKTPKVIGEYLGYPLVANKVIVLDRVDNSIGIRISVGPDEFLWGKVSEDPVGTFGSLDYGIFNDVDKYISNLKSQVEADEKQLAYAKEVQGGEFSKKAEYDAVVKRQKELETMLRTEIKEKPPVSDLRSEAGQVDISMLEKPAQMIRETINLLSPTTFVNQRALDEIYKAKGGKDKVEFELEVQMKQFRDMFDKMPEAEQVAFIDAIKRGEKQPTPLLQAIADMMRQVEDAHYTEVKKYKPNAAWMDNHYRVLWKVIPGQPKKKGFKGLFRRPLQGTKGFLKQHTLNDMSEGLAKGGVPYSYNPMVMWQMAIMDMKSFIVANQMFSAMKKMGMVKYVKMGQEVPENFVRLNDSIAKVYFPASSGEGLVNAGEWYIEGEVGRVLNNYLSRDNIRNSAFGSTLLAFKNITTSLELSLSTFHALYESGAAISTKAGLGLQKIVNRGDLIGGLTDLITMGTAPGQDTAAGGRAIKYVTNKNEFLKTLEGQSFIKEFPDAEQLIDDAFIGGMKFAIHQDYKDNSLRALKEGVKRGDAWAVTMNAVPGLNTALMAPMFEWFIPRLKLGAFLYEMQNAVIQSQGRLASGKITRAELARQVVQSIENRFGEMNFDNLFWDRNFKTAMQLIVRSVTWKVGAIKNVTTGIPEQLIEIGKAVEEGRAPQLKSNFAYLLGIALMVATLSTIFQELMIGELPKDWKDIMMPRYNKNGDRTLWNTHIKDWIHMIHNLPGFVTSSLTGEIGKIIQLWQNRDFYGTEIVHDDDPAAMKIWDAAKHLFPTPFSLSQYAKLSESEAPDVVKGMAAIGMTQVPPKYIINTPAEQEASELFERNHRPTGTKTKEQFEHSKLKTTLRNDYKRTGIEDKINKAVDEGKITDKERDQIIESAEKSPIERMVRGFTVEEIIKVMEKANEEEMKVLWPIAQDKFERKMDQDLQESDRNRIEKKFEDFRKSRGL